MMKYFGWQFNSEKRDYLFFIKGVSINDYNLNNIDNSEGIKFVRNVINNDEIPLVQKIVDDLLQPTKASTYFHSDSRKKKSFLELKDNAKRIAAKLVISKITDDIGYKRNEVLSILNYTTKFIKRAIFQQEKCNIQY